jgi:thymidine kinase
MSNENNCGYLELIMGCMFSGKTSCLLTKVNKLRSIGINPLIINSAINTRDENCVLNNHDKQKIECITLKKLSDINIDILNSYSHILIDESQFFSDLKISVIYWCDILKKKISVFGLDGDFRREKFGEIIDLIPFADDVIKNKGYCAICKNTTPSLFSSRITLDNDQTLIGSGDKYIPVCRNHYLMMNK